MSIVVLCRECWYLDVLDGHNRAGEVHVRVDLDDDGVHSIWENILEVLTRERIKSKWYKKIGANPDILNTFLCVTTACIVHVIKG